MKAALILSKGEGILLIRAEIPEHTKSKGKSGELVSIGL